MPDRSLPQPISLLWNATSGWSEGRAEAEAVRTVLLEADPGLCVRRIHHGHHLRAAITEMVRSGTATLVAAGGDGTLNAVASVLAETPVRLGVIPAGTLNHFARDLGLALEPATAARQLLSGRDLAVDLGEVNGHVFINNSVLGLYPIYRAARKAIESHGFGSTALGRFFAVLAGMLRVFWRLPHLRLRLITAEGVHHIESPFVLIANNEHELEKGRVGKRTTLNKGQLWVYVMRRSSRLALLRYFIAFVAGRFSRADAFDEFEVQEVRIESKRKRIGVSIDGEIVPLRSPLDYRCRPSALRVIVPEDCPLE